MSEDAWQGDAQFTITVDGQVGGVQTATASHGGGQSQAVSVAGSFAAGSHSVSVNFLNDAWGGTAATDRNLHVDRATLDGTTITGSKMDLLQGGPSGFTFGSPAVSGADTLVLQVSEDAWQGDAQFAVTVDGVQQGAFTAIASHAAGAVQAISLRGGWGAGAHSVGVAFLNDAYGGTAATDRNLYVNGISYDGAGVGGASAALLSNGVAAFTVPAAGAPAAVNQALTLHLAEDAWQGDAHYSVAIDGKTVTADSIVTASNGAGQSQATSLSALLTPGAHDLSVSFLNDAWGGTPATDRNLYVREVDVGGTPVSGASAALYSAGTTHFHFVVPSAAA
ncbi:MAG: carbohydrate-binding domain-containing protein [Janthinobacterium lividum]